MHKILSTSDRLNIGAKAENLIKLDNLSLCPNFIILDNSVFLDHIRDFDFPKEASSRLSLKKCILAKKMDLNLQNQINKYLYSLNIKNLIVRSSFPGEDSRQHSYAGLFESLRTDKEQLAFSIKKIWACQFDKGIEIYSRKGKMTSNIGMAVIIQEYVVPELSGVIFHYSKADETLIEFTDVVPSGVETGKISPKTIVINKGVMLVKEPVQNIRLSWLRDIFFFIKSASKAFNYENFDAEFVVKGEKISFVQIRSITKKISPAGNFIFLDLNLSKIINQDISVRCLAAFFLQFGIRIDLKKITYTDNALLLDYKTFSTMIDIFYFKSLSRTFIKMFYKMLIDFQKNEEIKSRKDTSIKQHIFYLKNYLVAIFLCDGLINMMTQLLKWKLKKEGKDEVSHPELFKPFKMTLSSRVFLNMLKSGKPRHGSAIDAPEFINGCSKIKLKKLESRLENYMRQKNVPARTDVLNLQKLVWLHDANNFFIETITKNHEAKIQKIAGVSKLNVLHKTPIVKLMNMDSAGLVKLLRKPGSFRKRLHPVKKDFKSVKFPLEGMVACHGDFKGRARIVPFLSKINRISPDEIIITRETSPHLVAAMAVCRGVITRAGGLTSHAAIISRELNVPCIVGVRECLSAIKNGDLIRVINGKIYKVSGISAKPTRVK